MNLSTVISVGAPRVFLLGKGRCGPSVGVPKPIFAIWRVVRKLGPSKERDGPHWRGATIGEYGLRKRPVTTSADRQPSAMCTKWSSVGNNDLMRMLALLASVCVLFCRCWFTRGRFRAAELWRWRCGLVEKPVCRKALRCQTGAGRVEGRGGLLWTRWRGGPFRRQRCGARGVALALSEGHCYT
jgi:hypothetical protein